MMTTMTCLNCVMIVVEFLSCYVEELNRTGFGRLHMQSIC